MRVVRLLSAVALAGAFSGLLAATAAGSAHAGSGDLNVFVGYADTVRADPANFPTPWEGSSGVIYEGCTPSASCDFDAGAVRLDNQTGSALSIDSVVLHFDTCTYDIWPHDVSLPDGGQLVVTQTTSGADNGCSPGNGHMDSSDIGPGGVGWAGHCDNSGITPTVDVTIGGTTTSYSDDGQVLNTGGIDVVSCGADNESAQWTAIGSTACLGSTLSLTPLTQTVDTGTNASVTAHLENSCGTPLSNTQVDFAVTAGPNSGVTGSGNTDASGNTTFSYPGAVPGEDTVEASVTNTAGTFTSNDVTVDWVVAGNPTTVSCTHFPATASQPDYNKCVVYDADGINRIKVVDVKTHLVEQKTGISCKPPGPTTHATVRINNDGNSHNLIVTDCANPKSSTRFRVAPDGRST
ncbi:MAG: hypothetical protein ACJ735_05085 [Actinomycetes bacterium]